MDNKDSKLGRNLIFSIIAIFIFLLAFSQQIQALLQNQILYTQSPFPGLTWFQILNLVVCLLLFSVCSILGYKKAHEKGLNPIGWAIICFVFNFWGYVYLLFYKNENNRISQNKPFTAERKKRAR